MSPQQALHPRCGASWQPDLASNYMNEHNKSGPENKDVPLARRVVKMSGWLQSALDRVRDFAYAGPPTATAESVTAPRKVGLALGGGFARGISHLGVLH